MQSRKRQLHLGLHARRARDTTPAGLRGDVLQQGGLTDPRLAAEDQHGTPSRPDVVQHPFQRGALVVAVAQHPG